MTMAEPIGKFPTTVERYVLLGRTTRKVDLDITWVSCGSYSIDVMKAEDLNEEQSPDYNPHVQPKMDFRISLTPNQIEKVIELYPEAEDSERPTCHKPFYEDYDMDRGMMDMGQDTHFQAFKRKDRVALVNNHFSYGLPSGDINVLNMPFDDFVLLKEYLDDPKGDGSGPGIFYSGCKISAWPSEGSKKEPDE